MRVLVLGLVALMLGGCVTVSNTLAPDQVATFRLAGVEVTTPPGARVSWGDGEVAYASTRGIAPQNVGTVSNTPEAQAYIRQGVSSRLKAAFERELAGRLVGTRPVRVVVTVRDVEIASVLQRILVGGHHRMVGDVALVDARTGAVLSQYPAQASISLAGQGIGGSLIDAAVAAPPIDRVTANFAEQYRDWLLRS